MEGARNAREGRSRLFLPDCFQLRPQSGPEQPLIPVSSYSNTCKTSLMTPFRDTSTRQAATPPQRSRPAPRSSTVKLHVLVIPVSSLYSLRPIPRGPGRSVSYLCYRPNARAFLLAFSIILEPVIHGIDAIIAIIILFIHQDGNVTRFYLEHFEFTFLLRGRRYKILMFIEIDINHRKSLASRS